MTVTLQTLYPPETTINTPMKVYCDASYNHRKEIATAGWCFRTHTDGFLDMDGCSLGKGYDTMSAEMESIKRVLRALNGYEQVQHVKLYSDCKPAVEKLTDSADLEHGNFESVTLEWIPREENVLADRAAKEKYQERPQIVETPKFGICD